VANLLNINTWTISNDTIGYWEHWGAIGESRRFIGPDPWGNNTILWESNKIDSEYDTYEGGWARYGEFPTVDISYRYRLSVWVKRTSDNASRFLFGTNGYTSSLSEVGLTLVSNKSTTTNNYFYTDSSSTWTKNQWYLFVGHIHPYGYIPTTSHYDTGMWNLSSTKLLYYDDFQFPATITRGNHRAFIYQTANPNTHLFVYPRLEKCDGTEPSLYNLLRNGKYVTNIQIGSRFLPLQAKDVISN
jgi:hypothetical protein